MMQKKISFIGSGNVAGQLARAFDREGYVIHQIISRHKENAFNLAKKFGSYHSDKVQDLYADIDLLVIAVSDDAIVHVAGEIDLANTLVVHTSGAVPMDVLKECSRNWGILYPLQSFSGSEIDIRSTPVLIEGSDVWALEQIEDYAFAISNTVVPMSSADRRKIHLAAVIVNNFTNFLYSVSDTYLKQNNLSFEILLPLVKETVAKLDRMPPHEAQTGPARRGDHDTINRHLEMLKEDEKMARLYALLSKMIEEGYGEG